VAVSDHVVDETLRRSLYDHLLEYEYKKRSDISSSGIKNIVDPHLYGAISPSRCISSVFSIEGTNPSLPQSYCVKITSEINNLDQLYLNGKEIHQDLAQIFAKMLPLFEEVTGILLTSHGTHLEVIVKIQSFELVPGDSIDSQITDEGHIENVIGTGLFFFQADEGIQGGALELSDLKGDNGPVRILPKEGISVVFSNLLSSSKLTKLYCLLPEEEKGRSVSTLGNLAATVGLDDYTQKIAAFSNSIGISRVETNIPKKLTRQFVSFAIVDPIDGMKVPKGAPSSSKLLPVNLRHHHLRVLVFPMEFPHDVKEIIVDYLLGTMEQACEIRLKLFEYRVAHSVRGV